MERAEEEQEEKEEEEEEKEERLERKVSKGRRAKRKKRESESVMGRNRTNRTKGRKRAECEESWRERKGGWKRGKKEKNPGVRERSDARESASAGVIWKCWSNISFRLDSAILLSASRRLPLYPKPSRGGWSRWWRRSRAALPGMGMLDRGLKRPIEDLQTRCRPSLAPFLSHSVRLVPLSIQPSYPSSSLQPFSILRSSPLLFHCLSSLSTTHKGE